MEKDVANKVWKEISSLGVAGQEPNHVLKEIVIGMKARDS